MKRRVALVAGIAALLIAPEPSAGQQPQSRLPRVGVLSPAASPSTKLWDAFREGLRDLGYIDGRNITIEYRLFAGNYSRLPEMTTDLVGLPADVIVTDGVNIAKFVHDATRTIPIVFLAGGDPVAAGLAKSLAHPGGNVTGVVLLITEVSAKRLQLLKEAFPAISRVAALSDPSVLPYHIRAAEEAAHLLALQLRTIDIATPDQISAGFEAAVAAGAEGLTILPSGIFWNERAQVVALAAKTRLPAIYEVRDFTEAGGLFSYGPNVVDNFRRAAWYVDQILKGAKPADLPIEQPTKFELVVNLKTARELGLTIPPSILARADEVIE
jgi:putative ABC transport system substrate-binding protein